MAVKDPEAFVDYYANDLVALGARAWLGPGYQVTAQANIVRPGGAGQTVHPRTTWVSWTPSRRRYPAHVHAMSPQLTLQGAVAHVDMPVESGPTLYLPHSQKYDLGYLAYWLPGFPGLLRANHVQLPLTAGDLVWFNPALFHAAGTNAPSDIQRMANLLQVNSASVARWSRSTGRVVEAIHPALAARVASGWGEEAVANVVAASAGLSVPEQPRPRPAGRRDGPAVAGRGRGRSAGRGPADRGLVARLATQAATTATHCPHPQPRTPARTPGTNLSAHPDVRVSGTGCLSSRPSSRSTPTARSTESPDQLPRIGLTDEEPGRRRSSAALAHPPLAIRARTTKCASCASHMPRTSGRDPRSEAIEVGADVGDPPQVDIADVSIVDPITRAAAPGGRRRSPPRGGQQRRMPWGRRVGGSPRRRSPLNPAQRWPRKSNPALSRIRSMARGSRWCR